jgi:uncharacterized membrane protein SpoIIM required for sporulation
MREGTFIDRNRKRWESYQEESPDPDVQAERFVELVDDLAYARTHYPQSRTTAYLNALAARPFAALFRHRKLEGRRLIWFWQYELPLLFGRYHRLYFFTLIFFCVCVALGALASARDPNLIRLILGDNYVDMTEDNIRRGDPFGVYKSGNEFGMFLNIALHNTEVAMMTFVLGLLAGVGTLYMLFHNGIMLGSFQYFFFARGLGWKSVLVIWIHGTIEISAIVIAGTAGLLLGTAWLFPGTFTRAQSLKQGARDAVKMLVGLFPFFFLAAFLEGYVTRYTSMPLWLSLFILMGSAALIGGYFICYPTVLRRSGVRIEHGRPVFPYSV